MTSSPLTVIVPTGNSVDVIEDCLRSVRWADELLVVDSFSTDGTMDIARRYADRILRHEYGYSALQKNWAIPQASHEWILLVDTDERVSSALRQEVRRVLEDDAPFVGYRIPRLNYMLGRPIHHAAYSPDYQIRLFKRDHARYQLRRVHAHVLLDGACGTLQSPLIHYAHRSLDQTLANLLVRMTTWEAEQRRLVDPGRARLSALGLWPQLVLRPLAAFGLRYVRQGGWREGYRGLVVSMLWAMYVAITYIKIWEAELELPERWWQEDWKRRMDQGNAE